MTLWAEGAAPPGHPYWWDDVTWPDLPVDPPRRCDLLVIGAGYTGLSAALAAAEAGADVAVVDAGVPGQGASTRNGGMFGAHPRLPWEALARSFGTDVADAIFAEALPAFAFVRDLIERAGIECDYQASGRIQLAWTERQFAGQKALAAALTDKTDVRVDVVERGALGQEVGTERYFGGIVFPDHGALHPAKFHAGLLRAVLGRGVSVTAGCEVTDLRGEPGAFEVSTPRGMIAARRVVLATNGYTTGAFRWFQSRVFPLPSYLIATEPLPGNLLGHLAPGRRMMVETRARHSYFRLSPDGSRLLFGGRASMRQIPVEVAARRLRETMAEVWPAVAETRLTHAWTGNTGFSFDQMPSVGDRDGVHYAMGYSGSGTVMAPYLGAKAAYRALGDPRGETAYARTGLRRSWLHPTRRPHFLRAADLWYRWRVDPAETRAVRRG